MPEFRSFRAESIVLKHHDWGEADRILTVFTREHGKLRIVARPWRCILARL
jgi:DNA repair protein RecO (recombination protein O)